MVDKAIGALTEVTQIGANDLLVLDTVAGNTRKIKRKNVPNQNKLQPRLVQKATIIGDGTVTLPAAPTVGNLLVFVASGGGGSYTTYKPAGFTFSNVYSFDTNNSVWAYCRRVQSGDAAAWAVSASDFQLGVLYEFENAIGVYGITGGSMMNSFNGNDFALPLAGSLFGAQDYIVGGVQNELYAFWEPDEQEGLSVDLNYTKNGDTHKGLIFSGLERDLPDSFTGRLTNTPSKAAYGLFAVSGSFA